MLQIKRVLVLFSLSMLTVVTASAEDDLDRIAQTVAQQSERISQLENELAAKRSRQQTSASLTSYGLLNEDEDGIQKQFADIEEQIDELSEAVNDKTIVHSGTSKSTMVVSGRIHTDVWSITDTSGDIDAFEGVNSAGNPDGLVDPQDRLGFRRLRFVVKGKIDTNREYKIEMEFRF